MSELSRIDMAVPEIGSARKAFEALGFVVDDHRRCVRLGPVQLALDEQPDPPYGLRGWCFVGDRDEVLKLDPAAVPPTEIVSSPPAGAGERVTGATSHPNGVRDLDHIVVMVPALEPAIAGLEGYVGAQCRRQTEMRGHMMAFLRAGTTTIELVEAREQAVPLMWGLALEVADLDATIAAIRDAGGRVGNPTPAIQRGRIAASPPEACFGTSLAYIEPPG